MAYLTAAALREFYPELTEEKYPDAVLEALVAEFEMIAERYRGVAYEPREVTWTYRDPARFRDLALPHLFVREVTAVSIDGTAVTGDDLTTITDTLDGPMGTIRREAGWVGVVSVTYEHGLDSPPPAVLRACREWVKAKAVHQKSQRSRAIESQNDNVYGDGFVNGRADWDNGRPTGLVVVDDALNTLEDHRIPAVA